MQLVPAKATFAPGETIEVEVRGEEDAAPIASLWHLDRLVVQAAVEPGAGVVAFPPQPEGGYGIECGDARTAVDVLADPLARARYGFVSDYKAGRDPAGVAENVRLLHLNAVQFYDWMYRHARLLPPGEAFVDPLGRELSLETVRRLGAALRDAGSLPLGYAAVYAAGVDELPDWADDGLYRADGTPWGLGEDFLWNVDPSSPRWQEHLTADLRASLDSVGFAGFHLDQYGAPKVALRRDGTAVDLAVAFPELIERLARDLPEARLIFNNVNDYPTWSTAPAPQAAVYIEVWPPHDRLEDLSRLAAKARLLAPAKSVILAAYLSVFADHDEESALAAQRFALAAAVTEGATLLLHGEERAVLTEAYYVRHSELSVDAHEVTRRYCDFAVRYGDLFFDRDAVDVTTTHVGGVNEDLRVEAGVPVAYESAPGALWVRVIRTGGGLLLSLVDLSAQGDDRWDAPKRPCSPQHGVRLFIERRSPHGSRVLFASPEEHPRLEVLPVLADGRYDMVELPAFSAWATAFVPGEGAT